MSILPNEFTDGIVIGHYGYGNFHNTFGEVLIMSWLIIGKNSQGGYSKTPHCIPHLQNEIFHLIYY